jgi:transposase
VASFTRKRPSRKPFPDHPPRERVIVPGPVACGCSGGSRLSRLGEDVTETLIGRSSPAGTARRSEDQPGSGAIPRDREGLGRAQPAGDGVVREVWPASAHQPLNRQAERYAKEGVPISLSTLADQVGGCTAALMPLFKRLEAYVPVGLPKARPQSRG